jgi:hypothetical protein
MTNPNRLTAVESEIEIQGARTLIADLIEDPGNLKPEWIARQGWTVVPVQSADHFCRRDIERLAAAF